jgi:hypothetical protein
LWARRVIRRGVNRQGERMSHPLAWIGIGVIAVAALFLVLTDGGGIGPLQGAEVARLAWALALLIVIGGGLAFSRSLNLSTALQYGLIWLAILLALVLGYSYLA